MWIIIYRLQGIVEVQIYRPPTLQHGDYDRPTVDVIMLWAYWFLDLTEGLPIVDIIHEFTKVRIPKLTWRRCPLSGRLHITDVCKAYFGILYPNNCGNLRRLHHSSLLLILLLHLPCPRISFTLNSKLFSLNNPFLLSLLHQLLSVLWSLDLVNSFQLTIILTLSFIFTSFIYASVSE
jgi:hypothetical protein